MNACALCHRPLTDTASRKRGFGPDCWSAVLEKVTRAQGEGRLPLGPFSGDVILVRVDGRTYANIPNAFRHRHNVYHPGEAAWGYSGFGPQDLALNILSQFLQPARADEGDEAPHPESMRLCQAFMKRFLSRAPHAGCIILQRDILKWLRDQDVPESEIHTYGVLA